MPDLRPMVDYGQVFTLLSQHFTDPITDLTPLEGGQVARTFAFRAGEQDYIVRQFLFVDRKSGGRATTRANHSISTPPSLLLY